MSDAAAVWLDAAWADPGLYAPPIPFDPSDRGLLLGDGAFDTALVLGHRMVWRDRHVVRLVAACATLGFALDPARVERAVGAMLPRLEHGSLRITATRGAGPRGLAPPPRPTPTILAAVSPLRADALFAPIALRTAATRRNETSPLSRVKGLGYADAVLAADGAAGAEALFLNTRGAVACVATANLFAVLDGRLATPPLADGAMDGITRAAVLAAAPGIGLAVEERSILPAELRGAAAVLATSSLRLVAPVVALDGLPLGRGDVAARLVEALAGRVLADSGTDPRRLAP